jgi:hypothetical protein
MAEGEADCTDVATVLMTAHERVATVVTNQHFHTLYRARRQRRRDCASASPGRRGRNQLPW